MKVTIKGITDARNNLVVSEERAGRWVAAALFAEGLRAEEVEVDAERT